MFSIQGVNFDKMISNWHTPLEEIPWSVLVLVIKGQVDYLIENQKTIAESGDLLFIPEGAKRRGKNFNGETHQKYTVVFNQIGKTSNAPDFLTDNTFIRLKTNNYDFIKHRIEKLYIEHANSHQYREFICSGILQELIGLLAKELGSDDIAPMKLKYVQSIQHYILENYRETIKIDDLAKIIYRSPSYTISIFKEVTGFSPIQYVHYLRIMEACSLLQSTDMTIVSISEYLGYYDASYFSRTFKRFMSMSPKEFVGKKFINKDLDRKN